MQLALLAALSLLLILALPIWPYSRAWGGIPSGFVALVLVTFAAILFGGRVVS